MVILRLNHVNKFKDKGTLLKMSINFVHTCQQKWKIGATTQRET